MKNESFEPLRGVEGGRAPLGVEGGRAPLGVEGGRAPLREQIFYKYPDEELVLRVVKCFGLQDLDDYRFFSRRDMEMLHTPDKINELGAELRHYYKPCKARCYLNDLNSKNSITVLRQVIRRYDRMAVSAEKYRQGVKIHLFQVVPSGSKDYKPVSIKQSNIVLSFD